MNNEMENSKLRWFKYLETAMRQFFFDQNIKFVKAFNEEFPIFKARIIKIILNDAPRSQRILNDVYKAIMKDYGSLQYKELVGDTRDFNPATLALLQMFNELSREQNKKIVESSKKIIEKIAKKSIDKGLTIQETTKLLQKELKGIAKYRATRIARFEVIGGCNLASLEGAKQVNGKVDKFWIYTHDSRTRKTHKRAGQRYSKSSPIALDQKFKVGNTQLMYPADRNGDKKEIFNCRCTIGYVRKKEESKDVNKKS